MEEGILSLLSSFYEIKMKLSEIETNGFETKGRGAKVLLILSQVF